MHRPLAAALAAMSLATVACLTTKNFKDPAGPRYDGSYAPPAAVGADPGQKARPLRVVTFNVAFARHIDAALKLLRENEQLRGPDVLLLQEMDSAGTERIARQLAMNYVYYPSAIHPMAHHEFGTAILSPWPLADYRKIILPHAAFWSWVVRSVTSAVVQFGTVPIRVYAVHLPAPGAISEEERREQVQVIVKDAAQATERVIIGGDFNGRVVGPWFQDAGFRWLTDKLPPTANGLGLGFHWRYDHVFARGLEAASGRPACGAVDPAGASDHRAVWVLLQVTPDRRPPVVRE